MKKNMLKGWITTVGLIAVMLMGTTFANAGTIFNIRIDDVKPCAVVEKVDSGTIFNATGTIFNLTGTIFNFTGTIFNFVSKTPAECEK